MASVSFARAPASKASVAARIFADDGAATLVCGGAPQDAIVNDTMAARTKGDRNGRCLSVHDNDIGQTSLRSRNWTISIVLARRRQLLRERQRAEIDAPHPAGTVQIRDGLLRLNADADAIVNSSGATRRDQS